MSAEVVDITQALPRRSAFVLTADEMEGLYGAGPLAFVIYVWLRSWMDFRSGVVGLTRALSREMLRTYCESHIPRGHGVEAQKPTLKQVRVAIDGLVRRGLLVRRGGDVLVFSMPLARLEYVRPLHTGPSEGRVQGIRKASADAGFGGDQGRACEPYRANNSSSDAYPSAAAVVDSTSSARAMPPAAAAAPVDEGDSAEEEVAMSVDDMRAKLLLVVLDKHAVRMKQDQVAIVHSWARRGVTEKQVGAAIGKAKAIRARDGSTEPIWLRLVDTLLEDFKPTRRKGENPPSGVQDWRANAASINRMAGELGLQIRVVEGGTRLETYPEFVARIEVELLRRGGSVTGASDGRGA